MAEWWSNLRAPQRYAVALAFLAVGVAVLFLGGIWPAGLGIGLVLLILAGSSESDLP